MKKLLKIAAICGVSAFYLCGCGDKTKTSCSGSGAINISTTNAGTIQMGTGFTFTATVASGCFANQGLLVTTTGPITPDTGVITTPANCTLGATGSSCSYTVTTNWDNTKPNGYTNTYNISLSAGNATLSTNTISYTYAAPSIYLPQTGSPAPASAQAGVPYPSSRFTAETGCLTDTLTGLTWSKTSDISGGGADWSKAQTLVGGVFTRRMQCQQW